MKKIFIISLAISILLINCSKMNNNPEWIIYNTENSDLPDNRLTCIAIEENGTKWIGTRYGGLAKFNNHEWTVYNTSNSELINNCISDIIIDNFNRKWIITVDNSGYGELICISGNNWSNYNDIYNLNVFCMKSVAIDIDNTIWIVTRLNGIIHIDGENVTIYDDEELGIDIVYYFYITIDSNGIKWIGTENGLIKFDDNEWTIYNTENFDIPRNKVSYIIIDNYGTKWLSNIGLTKFDDINWINYNTDNSGMIANWVSSIAIDKNNLKWIGVFDVQSENGGLIKYDGSTWTTYRTENSELPDNYVHDIAIDTYNTKWICTDNGLAAFYEHYITNSNIVEYQND